MGALHLVVDLEEDVALAARNSTGGGRADVPWLRGAALLGVVAGEGRYLGLAPEARWRMFHAGAVRFSDLRPSGRGELAAIQPASLRRFRDGDPRRFINLARVDPPTGGRVERVPHTWLAGTLPVEVSHVGTMRAAMDAQGRAREGRLFGFDALPAGLRLHARVDSDEPADLDVVREALVGREVRLGRSRSAEFGRVRVQEDAAPPTIAPLEGPAEPGRLVVWLIADLALVDERTGGPRLAPVAADLGLPRGWVLDTARSHLSLRRYSPFNGHRGRFDPERQVIAAGSVLVFRDGPAEPVEVVRARVAAGVGAWRQDGLGQVEIEPRALGGPEGAFADPDRPRTLARLPDDPLARWMDGVHERSTSRVGAAGEVERWAARLQRFGVPRSQWGELAAVAAGALRAGQADGVLRAEIVRLVGQGVRALDGRWGTRRGGEVAGEVLVRAIDELAKEPGGLAVHVEALASRTQRLLAQGGR